MLNSSRYHYMTRISNGFQLKLESENVFWDYYNARPPAPAPATDGNPPAGPVRPLTDAECWAKTAGGGRRRPATAADLGAGRRRPFAADRRRHARTGSGPAARQPPRSGPPRQDALGDRPCQPIRLFGSLRPGRPPAGRRHGSRREGSPATRLDWPEADREPLEFARLHTLAAPTIPDALFARLRERFGDHKIAAMVLLGAYGNFQDRIVLGLNLSMEEGGPLAPLEVKFAPGAFQSVPILPRKVASRSARGAKRWSTATRNGRSLFDELQSRPRIAAGRGRPACRCRPGAR
ncbi:MAG: hypothetical protein U0800_19535 [Isosphaeraceae bacterium]